MEKLKRHTRLSVLCVVIGIALLFYFGYAEDEPNVIPPLLIVGGIGWFIVTRIRMRAHRESP